jgi:molybdopterin converting factor small subunit
MLVDIKKAMEEAARKGFFANLMTKPGSISVLLNGDRVVFPQDGQIVLKEGDEIAVLSPIAGG